jgi:hypothetical protein
VREQPVRLELLARQLAPVQAELDAARRDTQGLITRADPQAVGEIRAMRRPEEELPGPFVSR